ncbi:hypothetical protein Y032_0504g2650 [Ancylostoma ceylanicum]|uniref:BPTI/Kunitz inhibitor domain-containing protein n=1 Tax=Ancylostoma ceylanicum TaxID=53326 RepID=A0A016WTG8_9BILA|nr:hypothetical protein Y032_0504g2650 [Ancylostoma ceylanicum]
MKLSVFILFVVIYCCAAVPQEKCLAGEPHTDNTVGECTFFYATYYYYDQRTGKCKSFWDCFPIGENLFNTHEECRKTCMN